MLSTVIVTASFTLDCFFLQTECITESQILTQIISTLQAGHGFICTQTYAYHLQRLFHYPSSCPSPCKWMCHFIPGLLLFFMEVNCMAPLYAELCLGNPQRWPLITLASTLWSHQQLSISPHISYFHWCFAFFFRLHVLYVFSPSFTWLCASPFYLSLTCVALSIQ